MIALLIFLCAAFFSTKLAANYYGVCTQGANPFGWHIVSAQEYVDYMNRTHQGDKDPTARLHFVYSVGPDPATIPGDSKDRRSFVRMALGNQKDLIQMDKPNCQNCLIQRSYIDSRNCIPSGR